METVTNQVSTQEAAHAPGRRARTITCFRHLAGRSPLRSGRNQNSGSIFGWENPLHKNKNHQTNPFCNPKHSITTTVYPRCVRNRKEKRTHFPWEHRPVSIHQSANPSILPSCSVVPNRAGGPMRFLFPLAFPWTRAIA
jgi:hypothetical protein